MYGWVLYVWTINVFKNKCVSLGHWHLGLVGAPKNHTLWRQGVIFFCYHNSLSGAPLVSGLHLPGCILYKTSKISGMELWYSLAWPGVQLDCMYWGGGCEFFLPDKRVWTPTKATPTNGNRKQTAQYHTIFKLWGVSQVPPHHQQLHPWVGITPPCHLHGLTFCNGIVLLT